MKKIIHHHKKSQIVTSNFFRKIEYVIYNFISKRTLSKETEKLLWDLEEENYELLTQLDAAKARISKLQSQRQHLQEKIIDLEQQGSNKELLSEIKALNQEIKSLTVTLLRYNAFFVNKYYNRPESKNSKKTTPSCSNLRKK